ncbi:MAG: two-component system sensor histidine kinase NtrB, partial [Gaiellaceae bacterium]
AGNDATGKLDELISEGSTSVREIELVTRDGERAALELSTQLVEVDGRTEAVQGIGRDVRERKRLQQQLFQAQKMEAIGQLAGGVAHDFNNVLTAIMASSEMLLLDMPGKDPLRQEAVEIKKATDRASRLTQQLLAFSREQKLQPEPLDLNEIVVEVEHMLSRLIGKRIELTLDLADELGTVTADPGQIEQVIVNLVVNAGHAMPDGGTVTIVTRNCDSVDPSVVGVEAEAPGQHVLLAVRDTGHGMDEATRERIFEPFFTTKEKGKGTGLGLSTVHGIVSQSGGHLSVESELGEGTTFSIHLPRLIAE